MIRFSDARRLVLSGVALTVLTTTAQAGGFAIREQSAEALGNAFAGVAAGTDGLSAMFWNPATISQHNAQGLVTEGNASLILPYARANMGIPGGDSGNIGVTAVVPSLYATYGVNDKLTLGLAVTSPFGLSTDSNDWLGSPLGDLSEVRTYNLNGVVAYKLADWITLAAGVNGEYASVHMTNSKSGVTFADVKGNDIGVGFNAGVLLEPTDYLDIGVGFRSSIHHVADGDVNLLTLGGPITVPMTAALDTPETVTFGARLRATDKLTLKAGAEWANWSRFKELSIVGPGGVPLSTTPENWKDSWMFSGGADYQATDALTLRAGLGYEISPVSDAFRTVRLPDNDRFWLSAGASYRVSENILAHLGYAHLFVADGDVALPPATFKSHIDIVSAGATIDW